MNPQAQSWGIADDGGVIEILVPAGSEATLDERWPPLGLTRSDEQPPRIDRQITIVDDEPPSQAFVDGEPSPGGWERLESELALFASERLDGLIAIHAGVIAHDGHVLLLPGISGTGKSTLCVEAAALGAHVLSDEYALVDPTSGYVIGWQRPVRVRQPNGAVDRRDITVAADPTPVGLVALLHFSPGSGGSWAPITPAEAVLGLLANTVCARSRPDESLDAALAIARNVPAIAGPRGEGATAIRQLIALLTSHDHGRHG